MDVAAKSSGIAPHVPSTDRSQPNGWRNSHEDRRHRRHWPHRFNVVSRLQKRGHEVIAASPKTGINTITGEGLTDALIGAQVVVDLANSPDFEDHAVMAFFQTAGHNIAAAEQAAGVRHHIALSVVGSDRLPNSGYLRAKVAQEDLIKASGIPYTIMRSTQFFEFASGIAQAAPTGDGAPADRPLPAGRRG